MNFKKINIIKKFFKLKYILQYETYQSRYEL